ncbi:MAG TPA: heme ABC exporter ATP-binding protein CcmA [Gemmatimonadaceae bacterium]|nr:heme ABC exporter ATP-binding protein CcmA [Gemmatimonadaceae bacterium]
MAREERAVEVSGLGRRFGLRWVLRGVSLELHRGEIVALLGPNGSGKSTVLRVIGTLLRPSTGTVVVAGRDAVREAAHVRGLVGYLAHSPGLYDDLTARENLRFAADMLGLSHNHIEEALGRAGLTAVADHRVRGFSAGMQRRLAIARLILRRPRILLLDEPYSNLDSEGIALMNEIIADVVSNGGTALLALHELAPAGGTLTRTLSLVDGRIATDRPRMAEAG